MELNKFSEAELCKVLENSYRASNIAFIEEWGLLSHELELIYFQLYLRLNSENTLKYNETWTWSWGILFN